MVLRVPVTCSRCEGSCRIWVELKGAKILETQTCPECWGFGFRYRSIHLNDAETASIERIVDNHQ